MDENYIKYRKQIIEEQEAMGLRTIYVGNNPINEEIYLVLEELDIDSCGEVAKYLNANGKASLTGCPRCYVDDFIHVEGCTLNRFNKK